MSQKYSVVIHMGATGWEATVNGRRTDFRSMTYDQKKLWYGTFMDSVRAIHRRGKRKGAR